MKTYTPHGVCSRKINYEVENNKIKNIEIVGGCNGNLQGLSVLLAGMDVDTAIQKLKGIKCGMRETSCPDQIAQALLQDKK